MMAGETTRYIRMLEGLRGEGAALPLIVNTLAGQIRSLTTIREGLDSGKPIAQLMNQVRVWGDQQKTMESAARRLGLKQLVSALMHAAKIDRISKGIGKGDAWDELLQLGLRFAITKP
jgi:DNA polymerase-3 subunit delta